MTLSLCLLNSGGKIIINWSNFVWIHININLTDRTWLQNTFDIMMVLILMYQPFLRDQWTDPVYLKFFNRNALIMSLNLLHKNQMIESNDLPWSQCAGTAVLGRHNWIKACKIPKSSVNVLLPGTEQLGPSINALLIINVAKKCKNS